MTDRVDRFLPLAGLLALVLFSGILLVRCAAVLPFWYDELLTIRLSELESVGELWRALTAGIEFTPPLNYILTRFARTLPGPETLTARVPALSGYAVLVVSLFIFLRRRIGPWFALAAVALLPLSTYTIVFAVEARPYMVLLGTAGCALVLWQTAVDDDRPARVRTWAAVGLGASLIAALLLHVWAILLPAAILAGELAAFVRTKRIRRRVLVAIATASPAIALYPTLLGASRSVIFGGSAYAPSMQKLLAFVRNDVPRPRVLIAALLVAFVVGWRAHRRSAPNRARTPGLRIDELVVLTALFCSPVVPCVYAAVAGGAFMARYTMFALPAIIGFAGAGMYFVSGGHRLAGQSAAAVTLLGVLLYLPAKVPLTANTLAVVQSLTAVRDRLDVSVPIVLVNPVDVLPYDEQADDDLLRRTVFVAEPEMALEHTGTNGVDLGYVRGGPYLRLRTRRVPYQALITNNSRMYLAGKWQVLSWLPQQLERDGWRFVPIGGSDQAPLFEATRPAMQGVR